MKETTLLLKILLSLATMVLLVTAVSVKNKTLEDQGNEKIYLSSEQEPGGREDDISLEDNQVDEIALQIKKALLAKKIGVAAAATGTTDGYCIVWDTYKSMPTGFGGCWW